MSGIAGKQVLQLPTPLGFIMDKEPSDEKNEIKSISGNWLQS